MAGSFKAEIKGISDLTARLKKYNGDVQKGLDDAMNGAAQTIRTEAIRRVPANTGAGRQSISANTSKFLEKNVSANAFYLIYLEFGTGQKVNVPDEWKDYAAQFKGKKDSKSLDDFLEAIMKWVRDKGLAGTYSVKTKRRTKASGIGHDYEDAEVAYPIFLSIIRHGIRPQPFMYPAYKEGTKDLLVEIKKRVEDAGR